MLPVSGMPSLVPMIDGLLSVGSTVAVVLATIVFNTASAEL
jgi:hypothetical protein